MALALQKKRVRKRLNWKRFVFFVTCSLLFLLLMVGTGVYTVWRSVVDGTSPGNIASGENPIPPKIHERLNVLLLGVDAGVTETGSRGGPARTDTMMVASFDPETLEAGVISIPRDTRVNIPGRGTNKINAAHVFGGPQLALKTAENLLGVPIHYYVKVNMEGFKQIVDALGGIELEVEKDMNYVDPVQNLRIDLKAGKQVLDGQQALNYVRYRGKGEGDIGRIPRQQKFMQVLAEELLQLSSVRKLPELVGIFTRNVETDMDVVRIIQYGEMARKIDLEQVEFATLAGVDRYINDISYWIADEKGMQEQVDRLLRGIDREKNRQIRVQVLNGTGESGAASQMAADLRRYGFNVIAVGNADDYDYDESLIVLHGDKLAPARQVARAVEIYRITQDEDWVVEMEGQEIDITVIVGGNQ